MATGLDSRLVPFAKWTAGENGKPYSVEKVRGADGEKPNLILRGVQLAKKGLHLLSRELSAPPSEESRDSCDGRTPGIKPPRAPTAHVSNKYFTHGLGVSVTRRGQRGQWPSKRVVGSLSNTCRLDSAAYLRNNNPKPRARIMPSAPGMRSRNSVAATDFDQAYPRSGVHFSTVGSNYARCLQLRISTKKQSARREKCGRVTVKTRRIDLQIRPVGTIAIRKPFVMTSDTTVQQPNQVFHRRGTGERTFGEEAPNHTRARTARPRARRFPLALHASKPGKKSFANTVAASRLQKDLGLRAACPATFP